MNSIYEQLIQRRKLLGLRQKDMYMRVGMTRQQYQRLEAGGNPRVATLELVAKGLNMELMLIPQENIRAVRQVLAGEDPGTGSENEDTEPRALSDDPWQGMFEEDK